MDNTNMHAYQDPYSPMNAAHSPASPAASNASSPPKKSHLRTYQACIACRKRKVKCDMGDVENPHDPPCARCKRERKPCEFDDQRRKTNNKRSRSETNGFDDEHTLAAATRASKRQTLGRQDSQLLYGNGKHESPLTPGAYNVASPRRNSYTQSPMPDPETIQRTTDAMKKETFDTQGGLASLLEAADHLTKQPSRHPQNMSGGLASQSHTSQEQTYPEEVVREAATKHWSRFKFVRSGLLKASEAMAYVEYFYANCMPFTPICIPDYRNPALHETLLEREPFLVMTILTIASRFMTVGGDSGWGKQSRPQKIHHTFWDYTQKMFATIVYAQEQFGGGMTGGGKAKARRCDPLFRYGLRSITTVESLMLLCEWAPRDLHFPPDDFDGEIMVPLNPLEEEALDESFRMLNSEAAQRRDTWLEPAWRCDTMIWMLLHNAKALALEIGLFDDRSEEDLLRTVSGVTQAEIAEYHARRTKTRDIFWAFYVQTCGRLELIGKLPPGYLESLHHSEADVRIQHTVKSRAAAYDHKVDAQYTPMPQASPHLENVQEAVWFFWQELTAIMKSANMNMFMRKEETRKITRTGEYRKWIHVYAPMLDEWRTEFEKCDMIPEPMRTILLIEYDYIRIYIHSLPLQAFVERAIASTPSKQNIDAFTSNGIALEDVRKWMQEDSPYIQTLVESCQHVLSLIGESTMPVEKIKHFTVRVYFRIMASAVHLLKSFVVGAYADNIRRSFELLKKASHALTTHIVDDVHIGSVFSEMISTVAIQIEPRLKLFTPGSRPGRSRAVSMTPVVARSPALHPMNGLPTNHPQSNGVNSWGASANGYSTPNMLADQLINWQNDTSSILQNLDIYDPSTASNMTLMPPPGFFNSPVETADDGGLGNGLNGNGAADQQQAIINDWVSMDVHPLMNLALNGGQNEVSATHYGIVINGSDMLDQFMRPDGISSFNYENGTPNTGTPMPYIGGASGAQRSGRAW
ncbi:uncharacterized protein PV09_08874 [Verruconis gallopava]|uniref:Zn(2)-C6 fungal-type domain-containing protein n=1 Tax=Verruconis gallopava TaxID=253628 RepID=A0A0D1XB48_9PEZI|nr:uncharacterized protein PV09_08874 [Verruconis gallopava]KIV99445.1 hypothetical protein PV09_08874 [Verruconis gallopava]